MLKQGRQGVREMENRSVTANAAAAVEVATRLGGIVNGSSWKGLDGQEAVTVTVLGRTESLTKHPEFKRLKAEGKLISWRRC